MEDVLTLIIKLNPTGLLGVSRAINAMCHSAGVVTICDGRRREFVDFVNGVRSVMELTPKSATAGELIKHCTQRRSGCVVTITHEGTLGSQHKLVTTRVIGGEGFDGTICRTVLGMPWRRNIRETFTIRGCVVELDDNMKERFNDTEIVVFAHLKKEFVSWPVSALVQVLLNDRFEPKHL